MSEQNHPPKALRTIYRKPQPFEVVAEGFEDGEPFLVVRNPDNGETTRVAWERARVEFGALEEPVDPKGVDEHLGTALPGEYLGSEATIVVTFGYDHAAKAFKVYLLFDLRWTHALISAARWKDAEVAWNRAGRPSPKAVRVTDEPSKAFNPFGRWIPGRFLLPHDGAGRLVCVASEMGSATFLGVFNERTERHAFTMDRVRKAFERWASDGYPAD